jgi:F420-non-reducing hydrogenase small subunit
LTSSKPKLSVYWASSCGGCEIAIVNLHERLLDLDAHFDLVFCPCLVDTKKKDVESMADESIAVTLFNGAIRTEENEEMAHLLRKKSQVLVAFGACSSGGGIPALSNFHSRNDHFRSIYLDNPSLDNAAQVIPQPETEVPEGTLRLPMFYEKVKTLAEVVSVDYFMPGCPPERHQIWNVVEALISGGPLPPKGSVIGAGTSSVCNECSRVRSKKKIKEFHRTFEIEPDPVRCLLEQGIVCMGIATRDGCGAPCPKANMPCIGCYGPPAGVKDQGAKMVAAIGSILDLGDYKGLTPEQLTEKVETVLNSIPDGAGTYYKFSAANSILGGRAE